ncbi:unnamed protein product, partial [Meganyctiphanes norvegica]
VNRAQYRGADRPLIGISEQMGAMRVSTEGSNGSTTHGSGKGNGDYGNGNGASRFVGCGIMRGRRELSQIMITRPQTILQKRGTHGNAIYLVTNYFRLEKKNYSKLCLYHVDF